MVCHEIPPAVDVPCPRCSRLILCQKSRTSTIRHEDNRCRENYTHFLQDLHAHEEIAYTSAEPIQL